MYLESAEGEWKSCLYSQKLSIKHEGYSIKTTLSSYMGYLKSVSKVAPNLKWSARTTMLKYLKEMPFLLYEKLEIVTYQNQEEQEI